MSRRRGSATALKESEVVDARGIRLNYTFLYGNMSRTTRILYNQIVYGKERSAAGHTGHDGPQNVDARSASRLRHYPKASPTLRGHSPGGGRIALPSPAASRAQRMDWGRMG